MRRIFSIMLLCILPLALGCSSDDAVEEALKNRRSAEEMYDEAAMLFSENNYIQASEKFLEIEQQYPFSPLATQGKVMAAFSYYKDTEYQDAIDVIDSFVRLHPGNKSISYMYYLKAISYYERIADVKRDQGVTKKALNSLEEVITRFPESSYARDAKLKLDLTRDHLAGKQMTIGRFYQKRKNVIAAINRYKNVVNEFQTTSHVPEALYRLTELYLTLGATEEAQKYSSVLGHNYQNSRWYEYAYRLVAGGADSPLPDEKGYFDFWEDEEETELPPVDAELAEPSFWKNIF